MKDTNVKMFNGEGETKVKNPGQGCKNILTLFTPNNNYKMQCFLVQRKRTEILACVKNLLCFFHEDKR